MILSVKSGNISFINSLQPAFAIEVYESALKANPKDDALAEKIGQAYVQCHLYQKLNILELIND